LEDTPEPTPTQGPLFVSYRVRAGDTLGAISARFNITIEELMEANGITDPHSLQIGQVLNIPTSVERVGPEEEIIPDSELVYGPAYKDFDIASVARQHGGYLADYSEIVEGKLMTGPEILQLVSERFSVGPRVLLTLLEMEGGWVTSSLLTGEQILYPMGIPDGNRTGLYKQAWLAANHLNAGYYARIANRVAIMEFTDRQRARVAWGLNPGSAALHLELSKTATWDEWQGLVGPQGFRATYNSLFGDPDQYEVKPLIPKAAQQPTLRLPLQDGKLWYFTGGPHAGWVDGSPWAAVDFAPADQAGSCWMSTYWAVAAAPGRVVASERGRVVLDLDGDGFQGTGWALLYMHMGTEERAEVGQQLKVNDPVGHPSCEGGESQTSHLHFARLYNGQWIPAADERFPLVLAGWTFGGMPQEYDGTMTRGTERREAANARVDELNGIVPDGGAAP
jgi:LysM repeat protein